MLFAYFGPETTLPLTSAIAAVAGFGLMFGRQVARVGSLVVRRFCRRIGLAPKVISVPFAKPSGVRVRRDCASSPHMASAARRGERIEA